jgi:hypothetical protein
VSFVLAVALLWLVDGVVVDLVWVAVVLRGVVVIFGEALSVLGVLTLV